MSKRATIGYQQWGVFALRWLFPIGLLTFVFFGSENIDEGRATVAIVLIAVVALTNLLLALLLVLNIWVPAIGIGAASVDLLFAVAAISITDVHLSWLALIPLGVLGVLVPNWLITFGMGIGSALLLLGIQLATGQAASEFPVSLLITVLVTYPATGPVIYLLTQDSASLQRPNRSSRRRAPTNTSPPEETSNYIRVIYDMAEVLSLSRLNPLRVMDAAISVGISGLERVGVKPPLFSAVLLFAEGMLDDHPALRVIRASDTVALADNDLEVPGTDGAIGRALNQTTTILANAPAEDPELSRFESFGKCGMVMCLPLRTGNEAYGVMLVGSQEKNAFRSIHVELMNALAYQAAASLNNAKLYLSLREQRDRIVEIEKTTRAQLASELHDGPTQGMSAITMRLNYTRRLMEKKPQEALDELYQIEELARSTTKEIRAMLFTLRPKALEQGLGAGLEQLARQMQDTYNQVVKVQIEPGIDSLLDSQSEQTLFSIATEATNNARKHAGAEAVLLKTYRQQGAFILEIRDNGRGFNVQEALLEARQREGHLGLINLYERATLIEGTLHIESVPGKGTRLLVAIPLDVLGQRQAEERGAVQ